jgi:histone H3/H4
MWLTHTQMVKSSSQSFHFARAPMRALVRRILRVRSPSQKLSEDAMRLLQAGAEAYISQIYGIAYAVLTHNNNNQPSQKPETAAGEEEEEEGGTRQTLRVPTFQLAVKLAQLAKTAH